MNTLTKLAGAVLAAGAVAAAAPVAAHADTYGDMFAAVDFLATKYGMGTVYVSTAPMADDVYGRSSGRNIVFNSRYINNPALLNSDMVSDVAHGFHPGMKCSAGQIVAAHETAHVLDYVTGYTAETELVTAINNGELRGVLSGYSFNANGSVNPAEALADAMVAVECDTPTAAELALYTMLTT